MFNKSSENKKTKLDKSIETVIGESAKIEGNFVCDNGAEIKGTIDGGVEVNGKLIIGVTAKIKADVQAEEIIVEGEIDGNISSDGNVTISETGKVVGDISLAGNFIIEPGAVFIGASKMQKVEKEGDLDEMELSEDGMDGLDLD